MKRQEYERSDRQNILRLRREKDEFAEEVIGLKKEIEFLNSQLRVNSININNYNTIISNIVVYFFYRKQENQLKVMNTTNRDILNNWKMKNTSWLKNNVHLHGKVPINNEKQINTKEKFLI